jgi:hypothetical protein
MTPWIMTGDENNHIAINKAMIMATTPTMKQAADQYIQGTTGLKPVGRI